MLKNFFYPILLFLIVSIVFSANVTPGTWLTGWDTLHHEFNFPLAFERTFYGVWRADQGLGAVAGHSHMSELPRIFFLWISSFIIPLQYLRYWFFYVSLLVSILGMYFLLKKVLKDNDHQSAIAFLGAIAYLANLGTVQHFIVPFEMFAVQYAGLPWIFAFTIAYLKESKRKHLLGLIFTLMFSAPMAYAATLWYAFFACYALFLLFYKNIRKMMILLVMTLCINAYWILPNIYFAINHGESVRESKINRLFSPEAFAKNQQFGVIAETALIKNFLFDWSIYSPSTFSFPGVMDAWSNHLSLPVMRIIGASVFSLACVGFVLALFQKNKLMICFLPVAIVPFLILLNGTFPINALFESLGRLSPTLQEALRFPFTKFSLLYMLGISIFFSYVLHETISRIAWLRFHTRIVTFGYTLLFLLYFFPAFQGQLIHPSMRITIPQAYFQLFDFMNQQQSNERVALLPIHSFWGWVYYQWGFQGAGFLQFGIPQPILDRDYDRWNTGNEQYYREMSYAIYSQNPEIIKQTIQKFGLSWILFDRSIFAPGNPDNVTLSWLLPELLQRTGIVDPPIPFGDTIQLYKVSTTTAFAQLRSELPTIQPAYLGLHTDHVYRTVGDYLVNSESENVIPFHTFVDRYERYTGPEEFREQLFTLFPNPDTKLNPLFPCGTNKTSLNGKRIVTVDGIRYESTNGPVCDFFAFPLLDHEKSYVLEITSKHTQGFPIELCVTNELTKHCDIFTHLHKERVKKTERFLLPVLNDNGLGYSVNINNSSVKGQISINDIFDIKLYEVEYEQLFRFDKTTIENKNTTKDVRVKKTSPIFYTVTVLGDTTDETFALNNRFEPGWKAYEVDSKLSETFPFLFGSELKEHVLVNNWANGWEVNNSEFRVQNLALPRERTIVIFFLPQFLQWVGFGLLIIPFFYLGKIGRERIAS